MLKAQKLEKGKLPIQQSDILTSINKLVFYVRTIKPRKELR